MRFNNFILALICIGFLLKNPSIQASNTNFEEFPSEIKKPIFSLVIKSEIEESDPFPGHYLKLVSKSWNELTEELISSMNITITTEDVLAKIEEVISLLQQKSTFNLLRINVDLYSGSVSEALKEIFSKGFSSATKFNTLCFARSFDIGCLLIDTSDIKDKKPHEVLKASHLRFLMNLSHLKFESFLLGTHVPYFWKKIIGCLPKLETLIIGKNCNSWNLHPFLLKNEKLRYIEIGELSKDHDDDDPFPPHLHFESSHFRAIRDSKDNTWSLIDVNGSSKDSYVQYCLRKLNEP